MNLNNNYYYYEALDQLRDDHKVILEQRMKRRFRRLSEDEINESII